MKLRHCITYFLLSTSWHNSNLLLGYAGNIHLDIEEIFSTDGSYGYNFESTIMHEIGHSLGLMHTFGYNAIMNPDYAMSAKGTNLKLRRDDIDGIQVLYGK